MQEKLKKMASLRSQGYTQKEIATELGTNISHVSRCLKQYDEQNDNSDEELDNDWGTLDDGEDFNNLKKEVKKQATEIKALKDELQAQQTIAKQKELCKDVYDFFDSYGFFDVDLEDEDANEFDLSKKTILEDYQQATELVERLKTLVPQGKDYKNNVIFNLFSQFSEALSEATDNKDFKKAKKDDEFEFVFDEDFLEKLQNWGENPTFEQTNKSTGKLPKIE